MCCLILVVDFACSEVPVHGCLVLFQQLMVDSDVVVARSVLRSDFGALDVPGNGLSVHFLCSTVADTDLVGHPHVFRTFLSQYF